MEDPRDRLLRYIDDALAAETGIAQALELYAGETRLEEGRAVFQEHLVETKAQAVKLEKRLRELGGVPSGVKGAFSSIGTWLGELVHFSRDDFDRSTQNLIRAYSIEHLEIAMYAALATYARAYGDEQTARLAEDLMADEQRAADRLRPLIAASAADTYAGAMRMAA